MVRLTTNPPSHPVRINTPGILQREQDPVSAQLSSSPPPGALSVSYANQAAPTPSTESEKWKALKNTISEVREEIDKLESERREMAKQLAEAAAKLKATLSQAASLKEVILTQMLNIESLQVGIDELKDECNRLGETPIAETDALQNSVSDFNVSSE